MTGQSDQVVDLLRVLRLEASRAIEDIRRIVYDIRPPALDQLGLRGSIAQQVQILRRADLDIVLEIGPGADELPAAAEVAAYRIVTEALTNVVKHAGADHARVRAVIVGDQLQLEVTDDGRGGANPIGGSGLIGLADRVDAVGGRMSLTSPPGGGTRLSAALPVPAAADTRTAMNVAGAGADRTNPSG